ncbi:MAG: hypothetical protein NZM11_04965 [Anaerolineales bacterium]|nr:hypothetical protein [Anaerolineales bacterium]
MSDQADFSRRIFLRAVGMSVAGLALGGGAAWAYGQLSEKEAALAAAQQLQAQVADARLHNQSLDALITSLQGRVAQLDAELAAATSQNAQLANALTAAQQEALSAKTQLVEAQTKLKAAEARLAEFQDLIGLYEQLESVGLDTLAQDGLKLAAGGLATAMGVTPLVQSGVQTATSLLDEFEKLLPTFNAGLGWLSEQVIQLKLNLLTLERAAKTTLAEAATGVVAVFGGFIKFVLDYLPFNIGERTRAVFSVVQAVIVNTSDVASQIDAQLLEPLWRYVSGGPNSWEKQLVKPLREQTLLPASRLASAVEQAQATFDAALQTPLQAALQQRIQLKTKIAEHRARLQL